MNNRENFVYRIMQLQKQNNLNDHELSRLLGYKANNMNKIINFVSLPRMEKFFELCDFFNISPEEFFRYNDEDPKWTDQTFKRLQNLNEEERKIIDYILTTFENTLRIIRNKRLFSQMNRKFKKEKGFNENVRIRTKE